MSDGTKKRIACFGSGKGQRGERAYDAMVKVGALLAEHGVDVLTGGFGGAGMEAPAYGVRVARMLSGVAAQAIGYTLWGKPGNADLTRIVPADTFGLVVRGCSGISDSASIPLAPELQYGLRLGNLLSADGFILMLDRCGVGTMVELFAVLNLMAKKWPKGSKRLALLTVGEEDDYPRHHANEVRKQLDSISGLLGGIIPDDAEYLVTAFPDEAVDYVLDMID